MPLSSRLITVAVFAAGGRLLVRLAPPVLRASLEHDGLATLEAVCIEAYDRRGVAGVCRAGLLEWVDLARTALTTRLGRRARLTTGAPPPDNGRPTKGSLMPALVHDFRLAFRSLAASRAQTALAVLTLALGIGITTAVFSVLDSILWRPVPFREAARFVELANLNVEKKFSYLGASRQLITLWRAQSDLFDRVEAFGRSSLLYEDPAGAEMIAGATVTPGLFSVLGVAAERGRMFVEGDGRDGASDRVVVSDRFWKARLSRDPAVIGRRITLGGRSHTIVGVMPATFRFPSDLQDIWVAYDIDNPPTVDDAPTILVPFARMAPGVTAERLGDEVTARGGRLNAAAGGTPEISAKVVSIDNGVDDKTRQSLVVLGGAVGFLLLIVCANVANLALARSATRSRDFAVRAALGASRLVLLREALIEQLLTGVAGALGGLVVADLAIRATLAVLPDDMTSSTLNAIDLDGRALAFTAGMALLTSLSFGLAPALMASRTTVTEILGRQSRSSAGSMFSRRARSALVVAEVGLSIVLLVGAALMTRSYIKLEAVGAGFTTRGLVSLRVGLPLAGYADPARRNQAARDIVDRLRQLPGVTGVTIGTLPSETSAIAYGPIEIADRPGEVGQPEMAPLHEVDPDYFRTLGLPILEGRAFHEDDSLEAAIVTVHFAQKFWPGGSAVGGRFRVGSGAWRTIVGVAGEGKSLRTGAESRGFELYYRAGGVNEAFEPSSGARTIAGFRTILIRAKDPATAFAQVSPAVHQIDPTLVIWKIALVEHLFADAVARPRVVLLMMAVFAGFGLVLAAAGIYGVMSCLVSQRLREIGIRLAIGASPHEVGRMVLGNSLMLTTIGLVGGLTLALALVRVMQALLFQVEPSDPASVAAVTVLLLTTAALATWRPARRAMRVDPVRLLCED